MFIFIFTECVFNAHRDTTEEMVKKVTSELMRAAPDRGGGRPLRTEGAEQGQED